MKTRDNSIDALKGFAIILVIIGHICTEWMGLIRWIYSFHLPLFFMISGYVDSISDKKYSYVGYMKKKAKTILWPYYIWGGLTSIGTLLVAYKSNNSSIFFKTLFSRLVGVRIEENVIGPIWFLLVLFEALVIMRFLELKNIEWGVWGFAGVSILLGEIGARPNLPFLFENVWVAIVFVYIGKKVCKNGLIDRYIAILERLCRKTWLACVVGLLSCTLLGVLAWRISFNNSITYMYIFDLGNTFYFYAAALIWCVVFFTAFRLIGTVYKFVLLNQIGRETLIIMVIHFYISAVLMKLVSIFTNVSSMQSNCCFMIMYCISLALISLCCAKVIRRYFPILVSLR